MRWNVSGFLALLLAGGTIGCDSPMTPDDADVEIVTLEEHVVEVVSHEGAPSHVEVTIPFSVENRSRAPVYLAINCLDHLWAWVYERSGDEYVEPNGLSSYFVADCGADFVTIEPGRSFESSVSLTGPLPSLETASPFQASYHVLVDDLFAGPVADGGPDVREALLVPESERRSNPFTLSFEPR